MPLFAPQASLKLSPSRAIFAHVISHLAARVRLWQHGGAARRVAGLLSSLLLLNLSGFGLPTRAIQAQGAFPGAGTPARISPVDLLVRNKSEAYFVGDDIYSLDGANQLRGQEVLSGKAAVYIVQAQNDGSGAATVLLRATAAKAGWTVRFFNAPEGGADITSEITSAKGWTTPLLEPTALFSTRIEVTPGAEIANETEQTILVQATAPNDRQAIDTVATTTIARTVAEAKNPVDLTIRSGFETAFIGAHIYNSDGSGQTKSQAVVSRHAAIYVVKIQNESEPKGRYKITTPPGEASGWLVRYWDAVQGGKEITEAVTHQGWMTPILESQASSELRIEVTPLPLTDDELNEVVDLETLTKHALLLKAESATGSDTVKAETSVGKAQVDALIRTAPEAQAGTDYWGAEIYNTDGTRQTRAQVFTGAAPVVFHVQLKNRGDHPDHFRVIGLGSAGDRAARYFDALEGGSEITHRVTSSGWITPEIAPGATYELRFEVGTGPNSQPAPQSASQMEPAFAKSRSDVFLTGLYRVTTRRAAPGTAPKSRIYDMVLGAAEVTALMRGANIGPAYVGPDDPTTEASFTLSLLRTPTKVLLRAISLMDEQKSDTVKATVR